MSIVYHVYVCVAVAGKPSSCSQVGKQEYDVRWQRDHVTAKDSVAKTMIRPLLTLTVESVQCLLAPKLRWFMMLKIIFTCFRYIHYCVYSYCNNSFMFMHVF